MPLIFCAPGPLKLTVFGTDEVTLSVPAVIVRELAIPKTEFDESCNEVPLSVALKRSASPFNADVPVNVPLPADATIEPLTIRLFLIVKSTAELIDPVINTVPRLLVPAPDIDLDVPL